MGQGWQAHAFMISTARWGVTALNPVVMVVGLAPFSVRVGSRLEVVGADLLTVLLSLELLECVFGLLGGLYCE